MASVKFQKSSVVLKDSEKKVLQYSMDEMVRESAKQRTAELHSRLSARRKLRAPLLELIGKTAKDDTRPNVLRHKQLIAKSKLRPQKRVSKKTATDVISGLNYGTGGPPYDFSWQPAPVADSPIPPGFGQLVFDTADPATGYMAAASASYDAIGVNQMQSYAGVGSWYVPTRPGVVNIFASPSVYFSDQAYARSDYGNADVWMYLYVQPFTLDPFVLEGDAVVSANHIDSLDVGWYDNPSHEQAIPSYPMNVWLFAQLGYAYACWVYVAALTSRDEEGQGFAYIEASVQSIGFQQF
jgi:hypothetical protein